MKFFKNRNPFQSFFHSGRFLEKLIDRLPQVIFVTNEDSTRIVKANQAFADLVGISKKEVLNMSEGQLLFGTETDQYPKMNLQGGAWGKSKLEETYWAKVRGNRILRVRKIQLPNGGTQGCLFLKVAEDVTERRSIEQDLRKSKIQADHASHRKSEFLANMSHEIRTPMNAILGMTDLLLETNLTDEQKKYAEMISKAGRSLTHLLNDVLDFSKIEAGCFEMERIPFDLKDVLDQTEEMLSQTAKNKGLNLRYDLQYRKKGNFLGDPNRLKQVLINLIGNSIKFTQSGQVIVRVTEVGSATYFQRLQFEVEDTGIGMSPEQMQKLFQPFSQVGSPGGRSLGGTGLGLSISKQWVEKLGGTLSVSSQVGYGSKFYFAIDLEMSRTPSTNDSRLPVDHWHHPKLLVTNGKQTLKYSEIVQPTSVGECIESKFLKTGKSIHKILLVDDSPDDKFLIRAFFKSCPFQIDESGDGLASVNQFKTSRYDIVIMDLHMPIMDGRTATRNIRAWEANHHRAPTPIIILTADAFKDEIQQSLQAGCDYCITKPVNKSVLLEMVLKILNPV